MSQTHHKHRVVHSTWQPVGRKHARYVMQTRYAGMPGYLPADRVRAHVTMLVDECAMPYASIAADAGLYENAVLDIYHGQWDTVRIRVADALMRVTHTPNERQERVLGIGATRRLRALHRIGWPLTTLAEHGPLTSSQLQILTSRPRRTIPWSKWLAVAELYERFSGTPGPSNRARTHGTRKGWPPPLDWEDHDIDDPRVVIVADPPKPLTQSQQRAVRVQALTARGRSATEIAAQLGISVRQVVRLRKSPLPDQPPSDTDGPDVYVPAC